MTSPYCEKHLILGSTGKRIRGCISQQGCITQHNASFYIIFLVEKKTKQNKQKASIEDKSVISYTLLHLQKDHTPRKIPQTDFQL